MVLYIVKSLGVKKRLIEGIGNLGKAVGLG